jgi:hypothetical protein
MQYEKSRRARVASDGMRRDDRKREARQNEAQIEEQCRKRKNAVKYGPPEVYIKRRVRLEEPWRGCGR